MILLFAAAYAADCPDATGTALDAAARAKASFEAVDEGAFDLALGELNTSVRCIGRILSREEARSLHEAFALGAFANGDEIGTRAHFAAIREIDPAWRPSASNATLTALFGSPVEAGTSPIRSVPSGGTWVDGQRSEVVPTHRAYFVQAADASGAVLFSGMLRTITELPSFGGDRVVFVRPLGERLYTRLTVGALGGGVFRANASQQADWIVDPPGGALANGWLAAQVGSKIGGDGWVSGGLGTGFDGHLGAWLAAGPATLGVGVGARTAALYTAEGRDGKLVAFPDVSLGDSAPIGSWDLDARLDAGFTAGYLRTRIAVLASSPGTVGLVVGLDAAIARMTVEKAASVVDGSVGVRLGIGLGDPVRARAAGPKR
jgi:hypothetical protein